MYFFLFCLKVSFVHSILLFYTVGYKSQDQLLLSQQLLLDLGHNIVNMFSKVSIDASV